MGKTVDYLRVDYFRIEGGSPTVDIGVDAGGTNHYYCGGVVMGASDKAHFSYQNATGQTALHRSLDSSNNLGTEHTINSAVQNTGFNVCRSAYYDDSGVERITEFYRRTNSDLEGAEIDNESASVGEVISDSISDPIVAAAAAIGKLLYVVYAGPSADLFYSLNNDSGGWAAESEHRDATTINNISANIYQRGANYVVGMVYNNSGTIQYDEIDTGIAAPAPSMVPLNSRLKAMLHMLMR